MWYAKRGISCLHGIRNTGHMKIYVEPGGNERCCMCYRMWKMQKAHVCGSKCMVFCASVPFNALVTQNLKYGKFLHARNWLKKVPWWMHLKRPTIHVFHLPTQLGRTIHVPKAALSQKRLQRTGCGQDVCEGVINCMMYTIISWEEFRWVWSSVCSPEVGEIVVGVG